jgi:putative redox protein
VSDVIVKSLSKLQNEVAYGGGRTLISDEPVEMGGDGAGPDPYTLLLAALGSCISMTVTLYARRKAWPLQRVTVKLRQHRVHAKDCTECDQNMDGYIHRIERAVELEGDLSDEQRARLQEIAHKCPVHKTLSSPIVIREMGSESDVR